MNKQIIKRIIIENQQRIPELKVYERKIVLEKNVNYIITGQRRAGKTFLLYHQIQKMISEGLARVGFLYINFEDERLLEFLVSDFDLIIESYMELYNQKPVLFFDEIQNVKGWEKFVRRLADAQYLVYITGSNATMLSREMASTLGGRFLVKEIDTLSFSEFLTFNDISIDNNYEFADQRFEIIQRFDDWFYYGGFPEVLKYQDKKEYLTTIFQKVFLGDIIARYQVRNKFALNLMIKKLAESTMDEVSFNRIKHIIQSTGIKVGTTTLIEYVSYLEESFLIRNTSNYKNKITERETKKKYYFRDHGLLGLFLHNPESFLLETIVFNRLSRLFRDSVFYLRDNYEVDFYVPGKMMVQVCYSLSAFETREREIKALLKAGQIEQEDELVIVTSDHEEVVQKGGKQIKIIPAWKWILDQPLI
ncbi:MAG: ATP-binding protein [Cyclobacteriaceae bacterium]